MPVIVLSAKVGQRPPARVYKPPAAALAFSRPVLPCFCTRDDDEQITARRSDTRKGPIWALFFDSAVFYRLGGRVGATPFFSALQALIFDLQQDRIRRRQGEQDLFLHLVKFPRRRIQPVRRPRQVLSHDYSVRVIA